MPIFEVKNDSEQIFKGINLTTVYPVFNYFFNIVVYWVQKVAFEYVFNSTHVRTYVLLKW